MTGEELYGIYRTVARPIHKKRGHQQERRWRELRHWQRKLWDSLSPVPEAQLYEVGDGVPAMTLIRVALIGPESKVYHHDPHCRALRRGNRYWPVSRGTLNTSTGKVTNDLGHVYTDRRPCKICQPKEAKQ